MDIGAAGHLILFFSILVGLILVGLLVFSYAAYSFLVTLTNTAAGCDEVIWPGEPIQDWLFKVWYLGWVLAIWAVPASFVVGAFGLPRGLIVLWLAVVLWLLFPVGLLSSLSAQTWLVVFRPAIMRLLLKHLGATLFFYVCSGLIVLVCAALAYAAAFGLRPTFLDQPVILMPLAAVVGAAGWLTYARLLGRIAHIISQTSPGTRRGRRQERSEGEEQVETFDPWGVPLEEPRAEHQTGRAPRLGRRPSSRPPQRPNRGGPPLPPERLRTGKPERAYDPWAIPAQEPIVRKTKPSPSLPEDPYGPAEGAYEIAAEETYADPAESPARYTSPHEEKVEGYAVSAPRDEPGSKRPPVVPEISKLEEELAAPRRPPPVPDRPLVSGVFTFVFYPQTIGPCATIALGFFGVIALVRMLLSLFPA
jgi:hypothetical protein